MTKTFTKILATLTLALAPAAVATTTSYAAAKTTREPTCSHLVKHNCRVVVKKATVKKATVKKATVKKATKAKTVRKAATVAPATPTAIPTSTSTTTTTAATTPAVPAPVPPCANGDETPTADNISDIEYATVCLINGVRLQNNLVPLTPNTTLQSAADPYTQSMITDDFFAHVTPTGSTPVQRVTAAGYIPSDYTFYEVGENIAWGTLDLATPNEIVTAWVNSPEHLANILNPDFRDTAVSVVAAVPPSLAQGQAGATYDQEFGVVQTG